MTIILCGILNVTPDSFSDGGSWLEPEMAVERARQMVKDGAQLIDIGGDSTRPGSVCTGHAEEWRRIGGLVPRVSEISHVSVDTHLADTARLSLQRGAKLVNDVSAGGDPAMFETVSSLGGSLVLMHSVCPNPHVFPIEYPLGEVTERALEFLSARLAQALKAGIPKDRLILDPGMGAFVAQKPEASYRLLERFKEFEQLGCALMLGLSRKGFLKEQGESGPQARDVRSAALALQTCRELSLKNPLYLRVHNVKLHVEELKRAGLPVA